MASFKNRLIEALAAKACSQNKLEQGAGLSRGHANRLVHGKGARIAPDTLAKIAKFLGVSYEWLATGEGQGPEAPAGHRDTEPPPAGLSAPGAYAGPVSVLSGGADPTKMRCGATGPRVDGKDHPCCCELDAGHTGRHREGGMLWRGTWEPSKGMSDAQQEKRCPYVYQGSRGREQCSRDEGHPGTHWLLGYRVTAQQSPVGNAAQEGTVDAGKEPIWQTLDALSQRICEAPDLKTATALGATLWRMAQEVRDELGVTYSKGLVAGADEERERIGRQLETQRQELLDEGGRWSLSAADLRQRLADANEYATEAMGKASALASALVVVRGAKGPTPEGG